MNTFSSFSQTTSMTRINSFIKSVYNWMAIGLALTGLTSFYVSNNESILNVVYANRLMPLFLFIGLIFLCGFLSARINKMQASTATMLYAGFTVLYGVILAPIFLIYTASSIVSTFFICSATFLSASIYGMITKKDLTSLGQFLFMGLIGIIIAFVVNFFLNSSALQMIISCVAVLIFTGLTAYDTQKLKHMAVTLPDNATGAMVRKGAIIGAFTLYLDFMGLFVHLLHILGVARD